MIMKHQSTVLEVGGLHWATSEPVITKTLLDRPGVLAVEAHRDLSVRMIHGPIKENAFVVGIGPEATMKKIVDRNLDAFSVPPAGLTLSSQLASVLRVSRGDRVTLEVLEGKRPKSNVYVSAINEDYIGALAYMDRHAINAMKMHSMMPSRRGRRSES